VCRTEQNRLKVKFPSENGRQSNSQFPEQTMEKPKNQPRLSKHESEESFVGRSEKFEQEESVRKLGGIMAARSGLWDGH